MAHGEAGICAACNRKKGVRYCPNCECYLCPHHMKVHIDPDGINPHADEPDSPWFMLPLEEGETLDEEEEKTLPPKKRSWLW